MASGTLEPSRSNGLPVSIRPTTGPSGRPNRGRGGFDGGVLRRARTVLGPVLGPRHDASCRTCVALGGHGYPRLRRDPRRGRSGAPPSRSANAACAWRGRSRAGRRRRATLHARRPSGAMRRRCDGPGRTSLGRPTAWPSPRPRFAHHHPGRGVHPERGVQPCPLGRRLGARRLGGPRGKGGTPLPSPAPAAAPLARETPPAGGHLPGRRGERIRVFPSVCDGGAFSRSRRTRPFSTPMKRPGAALWRSSAMGDFGVTPRGSGTDPRETRWAMAVSDRRRRT